MREVQYRVGGTDDEPELRPARVVRENDDGTLDLKVSNYGQRDAHWLRPNQPSEPSTGVVWDKPIFSPPGIERGEDDVRCVHPGTGVAQWR